MSSFDEAYRKIKRGLISEARGSKLTPTAFICMKTEDKSSNADLIEAAEEAGFDAKYVQEARVPTGARVTNERTTAYFFVAEPGDMRKLKSFVIKQWGGKEKAKAAFGFAIVPTASFTQPFVNSADEFFN